jgi:hypothetical protein
MASIMFRSRRFAVMPTYHNYSDTGRELLISGRIQNSSASEGRQSNSKSPADEAGCSNAD